MTRPRSKTVATWLAFFGGALGAHRFYLHGRDDLLGWMHPLPTALGIIGVLRMRTLGQDDRLAWLLLPLLGLMIAQAMLCAICYGLTPDERWAARRAQPLRRTAWGPVLGAGAALLVGAAVLLSTIAFAIEKTFEAMPPGQKISRLTP